MVIFYITFLVNIIFFLIFFVYQSSFPKFTIEEGSTINNHYYFFCITELDYFSHSHSVEYLDKMNYNMYIIN
jgi:hypothetical protein